MSLDATTEFERLNALRRYAILDTPPEGVFDRITALAADMLEVPVAVVSLVDTDRVWYKSVHGPLPEREMRAAAGALRRGGRPRRAPMWSRAPAATRGPRSIRWWRGRSGSSSTSACRCAPTTATCSACSPAWTPGRAASTRASCGFLETLAAIVMDEIELRRSARQISRLSEALAETCTDLERRASFDPLTGVLARSALLARGAALLERAAGGDKGAALLMLDIDRFKAINDGYGHAAGDRVLKEVAGADGGELPRPATCSGGSAARSSSRSSPRSTRPRRRRSPSGCARRWSGRRSRSAARPACR